MYNPIDSGPILFYGLLSAVLTLLLGFMLVVLYRRSLARAMQPAGRAAQAHPAPSTAVRRRPRAELAIGVEEPSRVPALAGLHGPMGRTALVYALAGLAHAGISTALLFAFAGIEFLPLRVATVVWCRAWPAVLALCLLYGPDRRLQLLTVGFYVGVLLLLASAANSEPMPVGPADAAISVPGVLLPLLLWAIYAGPGLVLLFFLNRMIRAVGPVLMVLIVTALFASNLFTAVMSTDAGVWLAVELTFPLGLDARLVFALIHLAGIAVGLPFAWLAVGALRRRYAAKRYSDQMLVLDAIWLFKTVWLCQSLAFDAGALALAGIVTFLAYKLVTRAGLRPIAQAAAKRQPRKLLLLRVFGFNRRSGCLFDLLAARWRYRGSIQLIGAPDLAARSIDPDKLLAFIGRGLRRRFIRDEADLDRRMGEVDFRPDPDGRFRVNEFFCAGEVWRHAVQRLMREADLVVMDLRSFSERSRGCIFELQILLDRVPMARLVLLVDGTTDRALLDQVLLEHWASLAAGSPNAADPQPVLRLLDATKVVPAVSHLMTRAAEAAPDLPEPELRPAARLAPAAAGSS